MALCVDAICLFRLGQGIVSRFSTDLRTSEWSVSRSDLTDIIPGQCHTFTATSTSGLCVHPSFIASSAGTTELPQLRQSVNTVVGVASDLSASITHSCWGVCAAKRELAQLHHVYDDSLETVWLAGSSEPLESSDCTPEALHTPPKPPPNPCRHGTLSGCPPRHFPPAATPRIHSRTSAKHAFRFKPSCRQARCPQHQSAPSHTPSALPRPGTPAAQSRRGSC